MRTCALYNNDRRVLILMLVTFLTGGVISLVSGTLLSQNYRSDTYQWSILTGTSGDDGDDSIASFRWHGCDLSLSEKQCV